MQIFKNSPQIHSEMSFIFWKGKRVFRIFLFLVVEQQPISTEKFQISYHYGQLLKNVKLNLVVVSVCTNQVSCAQSSPCKANVLVGFLHCCVNENDQTWDVIWDIEQMMLSFCTKTLMKLCEGFGTPIIADHIHDKERFLSWVVFVLRENIENIILKPSWGSYQIKHVCVDRINAITFNINLSICTIYRPAVQYVFSIYNLFTIFRKDNC